MRVPHVRVMAALVAAITLHALLLAWPVSMAPHRMPESAPLRVELLEGEQMLAEVAPPAAIAVRPVHDQTEQRRENPGSTKPKASRAVSLQQLKTADEPARKPVAVARQTATTKAVRREPDQGPGRNVSQHHRANEHLQVRRAAASHDQQATDEQRVAEDVRANSEIYTTPNVRQVAFPAEVQSILLARIGYPARARRHGWQGRGEFQLDIDRQSIRKVTMLVSTGHTILDRAAEQGLHAVDHVPVADGSYRLPVTFRLR